MTTTVMGKELDLRSGEWIRPGEWIRELGKGGRNLWLASLGVVQILDERSRELFAGLVERGERLELADLGDRLRSRIEAIRDFGPLAERRLEERMAGTLERFGVPSHGDVRLLGDRIEELTRKVESLKS